MAPETDRKYMRAALRLARKGLGHTSPNPAVGAVIVKGGRIAARGYHRRAGLPHAEAEAIAASGTSLRGATLYVTLEPCCHYGRTPPCTKAIIESGITRVVAAMEDPNPLVSGKGIAQLREAGIRVDTGILEDEARKLNEPFLKYITTGMPFVTSKVAMTIDGKIATSTGDSKWITCGESRKFAHAIRSTADAILVGVGTVLKDDPRLTCRMEAGERFPVRVIVDTRLRTPTSARVFSSPGKTIIAATRLADRKRKAALEKRGATVLTVPERGGRVDLKGLFRALGKMGITNILTEGGSEMNASLLSAGLADRFLFFIAPSVMGGQDSIPAFGGPGPKKLGGIKNLELGRIRQIGRDLLIEGRAK